MIGEKMYGDDVAGAHPESFTTEEYVAPILSRLGTLGDLTLGGPGGFEDGFGGLDGSICCF